jgi:ankyrin repeat protein
LGEGDYDKRTPLHLAASGGQLQIIKFLLKQGVQKNPKDRWGATPLNDAKNKEVYDYLVTQGCVKDQDTNYNALPTENVNDDCYRLLYAAFYNDVRMMKSLHIQGWKVNAYDYDGRTALGIAASEGNIESVKYLMNHGANIYHRDAKGFNALDDAIRENR